MAERKSQSAMDVQVDTANLYREENFSDLQAASIRRLTPVTPDGEVDGERPVMFVGETTLMTQMGPIPVQFQLEAQTLSEALEKFPEGVRAAVERLNDRARELAREEASRIVVPSGMPPGGPQGGMGGGGMGGPGGLILK
ncbi:MAG: hypothetical protein H6978_15890 [Gammaproteobacteria bacterium]|nr:hypothetical protein [Gammaproteobacteria bacterium]